MNYSCHYSLFCFFNRINKALPSQDRFHQFFPTHKPLHTSRHLRNQRSFYMLNTLQETNISHKTGKGTSSTQKCRLGRGYVSSLEGSFFDQVSFRWSPFFLFFLTIFFLAKLLFKKKTSLEMPERHGIFDV